MPDLHHAEHAHTVGMPAPETKTYKKVDTDTSRGWHVLLFDDDVTPIDIVMFGIQKASGLSDEVAEMVANEAHHSGQAMVRSGLSEIEARKMCTLLRHWTCVPDLCPGVSCQAILDDT